MSRPAEGWVLGVICNMEIAKNALEAISRHKFTKKGVLVNVFLDQYSSSSGLLTRPKTIRWAANVRISLAVTAFQLLRRANCLKYGLSIRAAASCPSRERHFGHKHLFALLIHPR